MPASRKGTTDPPVRLCIERVTPERAYELLAHNVHNRPLREHVVKRYARDMERGAWLTGQGEPIHVSPDGSIGNGQHRLYAVIEADIPVDLPFLYAPSEYRRVADQGLRRKFGDVLKIEFEESHYNLYAAAVRLLREYRETGEIGRRGRRPDGMRGGDYTIAELLETYHAEPGLRASLPWGRRLGSERNDLRLSGAVATVCHYLFSGVNADHAERFFYGLSTGEGLPSGDPLLALRRYLSALDRVRTNAVHAALLIKAFNYWREGREVKQMVWRAVGPNPEPFPQILPNDRFAAEDLAA